MSGLQRYYEGLLLLLLALAFTTLASTGRLGWLVVTLAAAAFAARGVAFWRRRSPALPPKWLLMGLLLYLPVYAADALLLPSGFLDATLHLVVLAGAAKIFCVQSERDRLALGLLAILEVMAAALVTVSGAFFVLFLLFLVMLIATLVAHEMARAETVAHQVAEPAREGASMEAGGMPARRIPLLHFSLLLSAGVAICSVLIFFLLPRTTLGAWDAHRPARGLSGFSDEVQLGAIASLQRTDNPVMHIKILSSDPPMTSAQIAGLEWRGRGLTTFDGQSWISTSTPALYATQRGRLDVNPLWLNQPAQLIRYEVTLESLASPVLFFPAELLRTSTRYPVLAWDRSTATLTTAGPDVESGGHGFAGTSYSGISNLAAPTPGELSTDPSPSPRMLRFGLAGFLQLPPDLDPRIRALARSIVAHAPGDNYDRMQALTQYLRTHYQYSVDDLPQGPDPLASFLFDEQQGDCEYFASALAVMGRVLNIPTRVVTGFLGGAYNPVSGEYVVRGRDAHAWVEAYFPAPRDDAWQRQYRGREPGAWVSFDATPDVSLAAGGFGAGMVLDALSSFWQEWIVDYDWLRQAGLARDLQSSLAGGAARLLQQGNSAALTAWQSLHASASRQAARRWGLGFVLLLSAGLIGIWGWKSRRWRLRWGGWTWPPESGPGASREHARQAYRKFQRCMARAGLVRTPSQTAPELLAALAAAHPGAAVREPAQAFVKAYEVVRFGLAPPDAPSGEAVMQRELVRVRRLARGLRVSR